MKGILIRSGRELGKRSETDICTAACMKSVKEQSLIIKQPLENNKNRKNVSKIDCADPFENKLFI